MADACSNGCEEESGEEVAGIAFLPLLILLMRVVEEM